VRDRTAGWLAVAALAVIACGDAVTPTAIASATASTTGDAGAGAGGFGGGLSTGGSPADTTPPSVAISGSRAGQIEYEPSIVRVADTALAASWTVEPTAGPSTVGYAYSADDGATWTTPAEVTAPFDDAADSVLGADAASNVVLAFVARAGTHPGIFASRASAGETAFGPPIEITDPAGNAAVAGPSIVRLPGGELLLTYSEEDMGGTFAGVAARSTDGVTWSRVDIVRDATERRLFHPCVSDETGRVWVVYRVPDGIAMRRSDDGGITWSADDVAVSEPGEDVAFADPKCAARDESVWIAYGLSTDPDPASTGKDQGLYAIPMAQVYGDGPVAVDAAGTDKGQATVFLKPELADGGRYPLLTYYAGAADGDPEAELLEYSNPCIGMVAVHRPLAFERSLGSPQRFGRHSGLTLGPGGLYATFVDNASGASHVAFIKTTVPGGPCGGP